VRFAELRRLTPPTIGLVILGWLAGWFRRSSFATWLLHHTGKSTVIGPSGPSMLDGSLLELAFGFGWVLALPLIWWQVCSLVAPVTVGRARPRFKAYLWLSFALLLANPELVLAQLTPAGLVDLSVTKGSIWAYPSEPYEIDPYFTASWRVDQYVLVVGLGILLSATFTSLLTPIFILTRFHPASAHARYVAILSAFGAGSVLLTALSWLASVSFPGIESVCVVFIATALVMPPLLLWLQRHTFERHRWLILAALTLGSSVLLLAQVWFLAQSGTLGMVVVVSYWITAAVGLSLRHGANKVTAR
jgi:hypothetical protein